ncbi:hypothetical protein C7D74_32960, partial [Klebsiella pneumoniae]
YIDALRDALADNVRIWKALSVGETFPARTLRHVCSTLASSAMAPLKEVVARAQALGLAAVQLHGDEDQAYIDALR